MSTIVSHDSFLYVELSLFFFSLYGAHRDLHLLPHSFPTRRSSDLIGHSEFGKKTGLASTEWKPLWVVDFPMFEYDEDDGRYTAAHHPFTSPKDGHEDFLESDPSKAFAKAYDMVLNGWEIGGAIGRAHG